MSSGTRSLSPVITFLQAVQLATCASCTPACAHTHTLTSMNAIYTICNSNGYTSHHTYLFCVLSCPPLAPLSPLHPQLLLPLRQEANGPLSWTGGWLHCWLWGLEVGCPHWSSCCCWWWWWALNRRQSKVNARLVKVNS